MGKILMPSGQILKRKEDATEASKNLGHGRVDTFSKSYTLGYFTDNPAIINKHVHSMLKSFQFSSADIRGVGIHITKLDNQEKLSRKWMFDVLILPVCGY